MTAAAGLLAHHGAATAATATATEEYGWQREGGESRSIKCKGMHCTHRSYLLTGWPPALRLLAEGPSSPASSSNDATASLTAFPRTRLARSFLRTHVAHTHAHTRTHRSCCSGWPPSWHARLAACLAAPMHALGRSHLISAHAEAQWVGACRAHGHSVRPVLYRVPGARACLLTPEPPPQPCHTPPAACAPSQPTACHMGTIASHDTEHTHAAPLPGQRGCRGVSMHARTDHSAPSQHLCTRGATVQITGMRPPPPPGHATCMRVHVAHARMLSLPGPGRSRGG